MEALLSLMEILNKQEPLEKRSASLESYRVVVATPLVLRLTEKRTAGPPAEILSVNRCLRMEAL
jgi:hypothetical protein